MHLINWLPELITHQSDEHPGHEAEDRHLLHEVESEYHCVCVQRGEKYWYRTQNYTYLQSPWNKNYPKILGAAPHHRWHKWLLRKRSKIFGNVLGVVLYLTVCRMLIMNPLVQRKLENAQLTS